MSIKVVFTDRGVKFTPKFSDSIYLGTGADGATFFPTVSSDGVISWTNNKDLPNPDPVNIKGDPGTPGSPGRTPVKGVDYFTEADKIELANAVLAMIPIYNGEVIAE
jgi:hypothetical protein